MVHNKETKDQKEKIKMSDKTTRIPKEDILELLNELENEEKNNEPILHEKEKLQRNLEKKIMILRSNSLLKEFHY